MSVPRISVITPSFNSARTIEDTIESVRSQEYLNLEHIVIDGGSTDETVTILKKYPHILWVSEKDQGLFDAMNKGIRKATGEWIVILNSDDLFLPGCLAHVAEEIGKNPHWQAVFGDVIYIDEAGNQIYRREEACYSYTVLRYWSNYINHQTLFVRKTLYEKFGLHRDKEFLSAADYEFLLRIGKAGVCVGHIPAFLVKFRIHPYGQSGDLRAKSNGEREMSLIRHEYGVPQKWAPVLSIYGRLLRQAQKLIIRGRCDVISGNFYRRKYMQESNQFTSNGRFANK